MHYYQVYDHSVQINTSLEVPSILPQNPDYSIFVQEVPLPDHPITWIHDYDEDNDLDLYVASGFRSSAFRNASLENDRLYLNENGVFVEAESVIPDNRYNASVVCHNDIDNDGDQDLFIGNYTEPGNFGIAVPSYILVNENGTFKKHPDFELMANVTSAFWEDVNGDGSNDLLVTTEWGSPRLFINTKGEFSEDQNLPQHIHGLWKTSTLFDIDGDGDKDWLLGNWGLNTKFNPTAEHPLRMYHSDFDTNGKTETVLAYYREGNYYPVNSKDELAAQMTVIKKRFTDHSQFSLQPIETVLTPEGLQKATLSEVHTLASGYLENNDGKFNRFVAFPNKLQCRGD